MKKILAIIAILAIVGGVFAGLIAGMVQADAAEVSAVQISPSSYDFGDIYQEDGIVSTTFSVTNVGDNEIEINRLSTSCGCTTAEMGLSDLGPGESREMIVEFDPNVHPDQLEFIERVIYLQTSDVVQPEIEIDITGNVLGGNAPLEESDEVQDQVTIGVQQAIVFFNEACQSCGELVNDFYPGFFEEYEYGVEKKDYVNVRENRQILNEFNQEWGIPFELQSHIEAFVGENLLIGGHVPESIMRYLLENPDEYGRLLVYQDKMGGGTDYKVWDFSGEIKTYPLDEPITTYLDWNKTQDGSTYLSSPSGFWSLFAIITSSAFLDGINPCAIAVLLFFIAFLFSIKKTKRSIWKIGFIYIFAIYLAYFLIGIGLAQAIIISGYPHLMAYVGAYLVIALGVIQLLGVVFPRFPIRLRIPLNTKAVLEKWLYKATVPAAFVGGFVVGLCTFPCSGGIYVAIIGMLASTQTYFQGFGWMVWYNLIFVAPLIILLILAANPKTTERLQRLERKESRNSKVVIGLTMIALGVIIVLFFT
ncbi:MAG: DUF1573 domain-containing protein [Nitrospirae bacterium]|nr:DUF1573 domain-containing protein [Nitrospirota bacterium]